MIYEIMCVNPEKKTWKVVKKVETKKKAIDYIEERNKKCDGGYLTFVREGFIPAIYSDRTFVH